MYKRQALTVTLDKIPDDNLYMRGFIGGIYEGDRWQEISEEDFRVTAENQWDMSQEEIEAVSYTHLDVYKRQILC